MASNIVFDGTKGISLPSFTTTEKNAIVYPAEGATLFDTTQNRQNVYAGGVWNAGLNSGTAVASTSGTSIDFTGIPSWAKRITVMFAGVSTSGTSVPLVQIGSGSITATGYLGGSQNLTTAITSGTTAANTGWPIQSGAAANALMGALYMQLVSSNTWCISGILYANNTAFSTTNGYVSLSGALDRVRLTTTNGTDTFDAGSINILYE